MKTSFARRKALAQGCRDPALRITGRNLNVPNRWRPWAIKESDTGMRFSDAGAWEFIAECLLDKAIEVEDLPTKLRDPPVPAVVFKIHMPWHGERLYVKLGELRGGVVLGVSFHLEDPR